MGNNISRHSIIDLSSESSNQDVNLKVGVSKDQQQFKSSVLPSQAIINQVNIEFKMSKVGSESDIVKQWAVNLPLSNILAMLLPANDLTDVANLTREQISEITRQFSINLDEMLIERCSELKSTLTINNDRVANSKFSTFEGNFGKIEDFHRNIYDDIGIPNPQWETAMKIEHESNTEKFLTPNYHIETCPCDEWNYLVNGEEPPPEHMHHGREIKSIDYYINLNLTKHASLTRPEVIALTLYTGPMFVVWNTVLRKYPQATYESLRANESLFPTSIFALISAIQKISRVMILQPGQKLYRGIDGSMNFAGHFSAPDQHGCIGMMEFGFMSTTTDINVAINYTGIKQGKAAPKVFEIRIGSVDRGADIHEYSQYPGEQELLWAPHSFLEPLGENDLVMTENGIVEVIKVRVNSNLRAVTLEDYENRKKDLHMNSFTYLLQDLQHELDKSIENGRVFDFKTPSTKPKDDLKKFAVRCMEQCNDVRKRHSEIVSAKFNDDTIYRALVAEMLALKSHALIKMEALIFLNKQDEEFWIDKPLRVAFRDQMGTATKRLKATEKPNQAECVHVCKMYGLLTEKVDEVNELGESPLIATCADLPAEDKLQLLIKAGADVNVRMSYPGILRKGMTPLLTVAVYGYDSLVKLLASAGADVKVATYKGETTINLAAGFGHTSTIELLHSLGADVNKQDDEGRTPFYKAASFGHTSTIELLFKLKADPNISCQGWTPMDAAISLKKSSVVNIFKNNGVTSIKYPDV